MQAPSERHFIHGSIFLLANKLQKVGDRLTEEITTKQWFLLLVVAGMGDGAPAISAVADFMGTSRQNTAKMLQTLQREGYVGLAPHPEDRRSTTVRLTTKGRRVLDKVSAVGEGEIQRLFKGISDEQVACAVTVLRALSENLQQMERELDDEEG